MLGRKVFEKRMETSQLNIETNDWKSGVYILKYGREVRRVVKK
ncbi:MAG: T9SS type A sorting domain-containing protein [Bacteroidetes bacterium]|nr:T9SS type A sorting domain-containing protein [Bacteroidota bacterium]